MKENLKIAILGATSHIAKGLIYNFNKKEYSELFLFARSLERLRDFLRSIQCQKGVNLKGFDELNDEGYDVIINCIGISGAKNLEDQVSSYSRLTETFDNLILDYLRNHPETLYINFSSGAAYGTDFSVPAEEATFSKWDINHLSEADYYGIAKLNSETKHRALNNFNIVDFRIFSYFSRFIDIESRYLLTEIISCIRDGKEFITSPDNIIRDYIHRNDLYSLVEKCVDKKIINDIFDCYSLKPVNKFEILDFFVAEYGLKYMVRDDIKTSAITGTKDNYYSLNRKAKDIGYNPQFTSMDSIVQESFTILETA